MPTYLYILRSVASGRTYVGSTIDIRRRFAEHQRGQTISTRNGRPWEILCLIEFRTIKNARTIERILKGLKSKTALDELALACC